MSGDAVNVCTGPLHLLKGSSQLSELLLLLLLLSELSNTTTLTSSIYVGITTVFMVTVTVTGVAHGEGTPHI